jgi:hypothetical protein
MLTVEINLDAGLDQVQADFYVGSLLAESE